MDINKYIEEVKEEFYKNGKDLENIDKWLNLKDKKKIEIVNAILNNENQEEENENSIIKNYLTQYVVKHNLIDIDEVVNKLIKNAFIKYKEIRIYFKEDKKMIEKLIYYGKILNIINYNYKTYIKKAKEKEILDFINKLFF